MPQLMPLNWIMSVFMFFTILMSICWIFSMKKEVKDFSLNGKFFKKKINMWFW
uniref:ATP synthase F0 subunit 8 n=1 Tax=Trichonephila clavata TaxID=2740835 RepID=A0A060BIE8_TRICU|nr:ATP synthase F0 subunit 8 [Trichonephila clavata]UQJ77480.1 ATP synthase subunit 8 [Trichonephila clavata]